MPMHWDDQTTKAPGQTGAFCFAVDNGPVENYVTLHGNQRTVDIGAFLSPDERRDLYRAQQKWIG